MNTKEFFRYPLSMDEWCFLQIINRTSDEVSIRLAAQLFNVAPCPKCDYVKKHCKCNK